MAFRRSTVRLRSAPLVSSAELGRIADITPLARLADDLCGDRLAGRALGLGSCAAHQRHNPMPDDDSVGVPTPWVTTTALPTKLARSGVVWSGGREIIVGGILLPILLL